VHSKADFVDLGEAGIAVGHIMWHRRSLQLHLPRDGVSDEPASALCRLPRLVLTDGHLGRNTAQSGFLTADYAAALTSIFFSGFCEVGR
jgi:hypothetical protein